MKKEMLINVLQPEECRIAILEDGVLEELYVERTSHESYVGNIYKGRIVNIEPSIQAAFVDFGVGRNGFLHVSDVEPAYYRHLETRGGGGRVFNGGRDRHRTPMRGGAGQAHGHDDDWDRRRAPGDRGQRSEAEAPPRAEDAGPEKAERAEHGEEPREGGERGGRRRRGRRGRRGEPRAPRETAPEEARPADSHAEAADQPTVEREPIAPPEHDDPDRPRFMDSAERRTDEDSPPADPVEPGEVSDDDLFFPGPGGPQAPHKAETLAREPEPERTHFASKPESHRAPEPFRAAPEEESQASTDDLDDEPEIDDEPPSYGETRDELDDEDDEAFEDYGVERMPMEEEDEEPMPRSRGPRRDDRRRGPMRRGPGRPGFGRPKPLIQDIFKRGQEVLVQVIKEGIGTKGPTLSTYISIAGRYLVLMPGLNRIGVSRKITDEEQRRRLREVLSELKPPKGLGFIIRTAGLDKNKKELQRDLAYLSRLWQVVVRRIRKIKSPAEIYQESDMITRTIRDTFTNEIDTIWVDEPAAFEHAQEFLTIVMPRYANRIKLYSDPEPMFYKHGIENEIARIQLRHVPLPNGGSIVIDQTEALVAIDVNSGNFRADNNAEETAYQMNLLAAKEIARQLRLRDLGGVIVNDFIDMREEKHRRGVERGMREAIARDRARTKILKISAFGIIEMTRQRIRPSLKRSVYQDCAHCGGTGQVKTCESMSIDVMRLLQLAAHRETVHKIAIRVAEEVANYLLNKKRKEISKLEEARNLQVHIIGVLAASPEMLEFVCTDNNNNEVKFLPYEDKTRPRRR